MNKLLITLSMLMFFCNINANAIQVQSVKTNYIASYLHPGDFVKLEATIKPDNATNKLVYWETSNDKVAKVDITGLVYAVGVGECDIKVTTLDGQYTYICGIIVTEEILNHE